MHKEEQELLKHVQVSASSTRVKQRSTRLALAEPFGRLWRDNEREICSKSCRTGEVFTEIHPHLLKNTQSLFNILQTFIQDLKQQKIYSHTWKKPTQTPSLSIGASHFCRLGMDRLGMSLKQIRWVKHHGKIFWTSPCWLCQTQIPVRPVQLKDELTSHCLSFTRTQSKATLITLTGQRREARVIFCSAHFQDLFTDNKISG